MGATEQVEYEVDGRKVMFTLRKVTFGEYQKVLSVASNVELVGGRITKSHFDSVKLMDELMKVSVKADVDFHELSMQDGVDLQTRVLKLNGMGDEGSFPAA